MTTRSGEVLGKRGTEENQVIDERGRGSRTVLLVARRHVDLVRTSSATCRA
ncbi:putative leader peptide [Kineococcus terrestris]|uniref:putative leader peptide n=1 Tax=Kineococcus terrestris TaxID=2044856 RepID=UPI0034DAE4A7